MADEMTEDFSTTNDIDEDELDNTEIDSIHSDVNSNYEEYDEVENEDDEEDTKPIENNQIRLLYSSERHTSPYLTKYEIARVLSIRACQIQSGAEPLIDTDITNPFLIAKEELINKQMPLKIHRPINSNLYEEWSVNELELIEEMIID